MKILIIRNIPTYMNLENNTYNIQEVGLAKALVRKGHVCDIIFWTNKNEDEVILPVDDCGKVHVFYKRGKEVLKNTVYVGCNDLFEQYDILQPCEYNQIQAWYLSKKYPEKTVIYHGPYYSKFNKKYNFICKLFDVFFLRSYIKRATKFIVKSEMAKVFLTEKDIDEKNISIAGVGIDSQMFSLNDSNCTEPLYMQMKKDANNLQLLYIGRFERRRNIFFVLDVLQRILTMECNAKLYMIGSGEKEYLQSVFEYADKLGIRKAIVWQEQMEQKYLSSVYQLADFFLLPTEYEIFGMVLLEAMYFKTIVLTTKNGGSSMLIQNGINGFIIDKMSPMDWANCVLQNYKDKNIVNKIQNSAADTINKNFFWDTIANTFIEQYNLFSTRKIINKGK